MSPAKPSALVRALGTRVGKTVASLVIVATMASAGWAVRAWADTLATRSELAAEEARTRALEGAVVSINAKLDLIISLMPRQEP